MFVHGERERERENRLEKMPPMQIHEHAAVAVTRFLHLLASHFRQFPIASTCSIIVADVHAKAHRKPQRFWLQSADTCMLFVLECGIRRFVYFPFFRQR